MENNYVKLQNNIDILGLPMVKANLEKYIDFIQNGDKTLIDALYELTQLEMDLRKERAMNACVKTANFPFLKTLDDFDFSFQPSINKEQITNHKYLQFIQNSENLIFIGSPGVGKTHLATAIGIEAAKQRTSTYFISCSNLILQLKKAHLENRLESRLKFFSKYKLLIIDEVGFLPLDSESANLLFQLVARRYEKNSTIVTTNKPLSKWSETFGDPVITNAILDRLLHHSYVFNITGDSYRIKDMLKQMENINNTT